MYPGGTRGLASTMRFPEYGREPRLTIPQSCGGHSEGETPGPIPNPEVKPLSADGTAREASRESRTPPHISSKRADPYGGRLFLFYLSQGHRQLPGWPGHDWRTERAPTGR